MKHQKLITSLVLVVSAVAIAAVPLVSLATNATCSDGASVCGLTAPTHTNQMTSQCGLDFTSGFAQGGETCHSQGGDSLPAGWTETNVQGSIPVGEFADPSGDYNVRFYPNTPANVFFHNVDDNGSVSVPDYNYSYNGCPCQANDVVKPGCGGAGANVATNISMNPGDPIDLTVVNACKPGNSTVTPTPWGGGEAEIDNMNATWCYTAAWYAATGYPDPGNVSYHPDPSVFGQCDPGAVTVGTIIVNSVDQSGNPIVASWTGTGPATFSGSGASSQTYSNEPVGLYTVTPTGANPTGYSNPTVTPSSQNLTSGGTKTFTITWEKTPPKAPSCTASPNPATVGQTVTFVGQGGSSATYLWSFVGTSHGGSVPGGTAPSFNTVFSSAATPITVQVTDSNGQVGTCIVNVTPPMGGVASGTIDAAPNPCVVTSGNTCTSNITWGTTYVSNAEVFVSRDGAPETLFAAALSGNSPASWIALSSTYIFNLYDYSSGSQGTKLDSVKVTAQPPNCGTNGNSCCSTGLACGAGLACGSQSLCQPIGCGTQGNSCCAGNSCNTGLGCTGGVCQPPACGTTAGAACCTTGNQCVAGLGCTNNVCQQPNCGTSGNVCCSTPNPQCGPGLTCGSGNTCGSTPPACGASNEACCSGTSCDSSDLACVGGTCRTTGTPPGQCSQTGDNCCEPGNYCTNGLGCGSTHTCGYVPTLTVAPSSANLTLPGGTVQYRAYYDIDGSGPLAAQEVTTSSILVWTSSSTSVATMNPAVKGEADAQGVGGTTINATYQQFLSPWLTASAILNVTNPSASDFTISVVPVAPSPNIQQGTSGTYTVTIVPKNGFSSSVVLSMIASSLPAGVTASFNPGSANPSTPSTLTLNVGAATIPGDYTLTLQGVSGLITHTQTLPLTVTTVPSGPPVITVVSVSPTGGSAASGVFTGKFSDTAGGTDITGAQISFQNNNLGWPLYAGSCSISYTASGGPGSVSLMNDAGTAWVAVGQLGSGASQSNSQCTVTVGSTSGISTSGNNFNLNNISVTFNANWSGGKNIWLEAHDATVDSSWVNIGTWTVPAAMGYSCGTANQCMTLTQGGPFLSPTSCLASGCGGSGTCGGNTQVCCSAPNPQCNGTLTCGPGNTCQPPPGLSLNVSPNPAFINTLVTGTASGGVPPYSWSGSGVTAMQNPVTGASTIQGTFITPNPAYQITVKDSVGQIKTVNLEIDVPGPNCSFFNANPPKIVTPGSSTLQWSCTNIANCNINQGIGSVAQQGSIPVAPSQNTTYTLQCTGLDGSTITTTTMVTVQGPGLPIEVNPAGN